MVNKLADKINRRKFLQNSGRFLVGSGLAATGLVLGLRKGKSSAVPCQVSLPCNGCRQLISCKKKQARTFRQDESERGEVEVGRQKK